MVGCRYTHFGKKSSACCVGESGSKQPWAVLAIAMYLQRISRQGHRWRVDIKGHTNERSYASTPFGDTSDEWSAEINYHLNFWVCCLAAGELVLLDQIGVGTMLMSRLNCNCCANKQGQLVTCHIPHREVQNLMTIYRNFYTKWNISCKMSAIATHNRESKVVIIGQIIDDL